MTIVLHIAMVRLTGTTSKLVWLLGGGVEVVYVLTTIKLHKSYATKKIQEKVSAGDSDWSMQ
jgi:hypothetical protein